MRRRTAGAVATRFSLQPSRAGPPKSAAESPSAWMAVPIAPSRTRIRSSSKARNRALLSASAKVPLPPSLAAARSEGGDRAKGEQGLRPFAGAQFRTLPRRLACGEHPPHLPPPPAEPSLRAWEAIGGNSRDCLFTSESVAE